MKKSISFAILFLVVILGFIAPVLSSATVPNEHNQGVSWALEPFGIFYPGARFSDEVVDTDVCSERGLQQVLLQTYSWMFIPGPLVELCVYPDAPETVKSAGVYKTR